MPTKITSTDITVRANGGAYTTNTVRGQRASCTHSAEEAANRLGRKLYGDGFRHAQLVPQQGSSHVVSVYRLHGVEGIRIVL